MGGSPLDKGTHMQTGSIAMNVADLTRYPTFIVQMLIGNHVTSKLTIEAEPGALDGAALVLECDPSQARAIVDIVRIKDKRIGQYAARAYQCGPRGGWKKI